MGTLAEGLRSSSCRFRSDSKRSFGRCCQDSFWTSGDGSKQCWELEILDVLGCQVGTVMSEYERFSVLALGSFTVFFCFCFVRAFWVWYCPLRGFKLLAKRKRIKRVTQQGGLAGRSSDLHTCSVLHTCIHVTGESTAWGIQKCAGHGGSHL